MDPITQGLATIAIIKDKKDDNDEYIPCKHSLSFKSFVTMVGVGLFILIVLAFGNVI